jgi:hypothetical protein
MAAGSCGAIQGAHRAKITKMTTSTTPVAANGLWRAFTATDRRNVMAVVDKLACGILPVNNSSRHCFRGGADGRKFWNLSIPPSPLGSIGIIGLAGNSPQNPDRKRLKGQNPENKGLTSG